MVLSHYEEVPVVLGRFGVTGHQAFKLLAQILGSWLNRQMTQIRSGFEFAESLQRWWVFLRLS